MSCIFIQKKKKIENEAFLSSFVFFCKISFIFYTYCMCKFHVRCTRRRYFIISYNFLFFAHIRTSTHIYTYVPIYAIIYADCCKKKRNFSI